MARYPHYVPDYEVKINDEALPAALRSCITSIRFEEGQNAADRVEIGLANVNLHWLQKHIRGLGFQPFSTLPNIALPSGGGLPSGGNLMGPGPSPIPGGPSNPLGAGLPSAGNLTGPGHAPPIGHTSDPFRGSPAPAGLFDIDNKLTLAMGYVPDRLDPLFIGEITGVEASFPNGGMPAMTLVAHDYLNRLAQGKYARGFGPLPDTIIASILSLENRLLPLIEPSVEAAAQVMAALNVIFKGTGTKQKQQSHLELLAKIAATYDAEFHVEGDFLYLTRFMKEYTPRLTLTWGESLLEFSSKVSTVGQVAGVAMKFTLREIPLSFQVAVFYDFERESIAIDVRPGAAPLKSSGPVFTIINRPVGSPADITSSVMEIVHELRQKLNNRLTGRGTAIGDPRLRAGAVIRLEGLGPDFSGDYRVSSVVHSLDGNGYRTNFEVHKELIP